MTRSGIMIRIAKKSEIYKICNNHQIKFGCPANWINYANKHDDGIADHYEAIIGHVRKGDPRLSVVGDDGVPMDLFRSWWNFDSPQNDGTVYVRYIHHCLTPTLCLYSRDICGEVKRLSKKEKINEFIIDLVPYINNLGYNEDEAAALVIFEPYRFINELKENVPIAVKNTSMLNKVFFDESHPICSDYIKYNLHTKGLFFNKDLHHYFDLYRKRKKYKDQKEFRIAIANTSFIHDPEVEDSWRDNELKVNVPGIDEYSKVIEISKNKTIRFFDFSDDYSQWTTEVFL